MQYQPFWTQENMAYETCVWILDISNISLLSTRTYYVLEWYAKSISWF